MNSPSRFVRLLLAGMLCGCFKTEVAGTGTDTSTKSVVAGRILNLDGTAAAAARVDLFPEDFDPRRDKAEGGLSLITGADGSYRFTVRNPGRYNLQAVQAAGRTRLLITGLRCDGDTQQVTAGTLSEPGSIRVAISETRFSADGYLYVPGTSLSASILAGSVSIMLDSVPAGKIPSLAYAASATAGGADKQVIRYDVAVAAGETAAVDRPAWTRARKLILNTSASGANVAGDVLGFPVLVRLDSGSFAFSQAQARGEDIRFAKSDGTALPYEIEQWDAGRGRAAIWVKMDKVAGNDPRQSIVMYWGNPAASGASDGAAVFDTSSAMGFQGVWHLSQPGGDPVLDATANHYAGSPEGLTPASSRDGVVGDGYALDGVSSAIFINVPDTADNRLNFPVSGDFTLSAWVNADSSDSASGVIWDKGYRVPTEYYLRLAGQDRFVFSVSEPTGYDERSAPTPLHVWRQVTAVRKGPQQYLYVDGACVDSIGTYSSGNLAITHGGNFVIGRSAWTSKLFNYFRGGLDEVEASNRALDPDWIKLSHENQRSDARWVEFQ
jgi:Concanavalin A-like lectin/glucanases superfamily/Domain of unknown function (DUF2341)